MNENRGTSPIAGGTRLRSVPRSLLLGLIGLYQRHVSGLFGQRCRFHPTCSSYAAEAIEVHGVVIGVMLSAWRLLRCTPLTPGGIDPVPQRFRRLHALVTRGVASEVAYDSVIRNGGR